MTYPSEFRHQFNSLVAQGKSIEEINVILMDVPKHTLNRWLRELKARGTMTPKKQTGRPHKFDNDDIRRLLQLARRHPEYTIDELGYVAGWDASHKTLAKYLKKQGYISIVAIKKPALNPLKARNRLQFATLHLNKTLNDWKHWIFSDESSVHLDCSEGVKRFIIQRHQRLDPQFVQGKRVHGGGKLMIWGCITWQGVGPLLFLEGGIDANVYMQILQRSVLPLILQNLEHDGPGIQYCDDGASCHDAQEVIDYCDRVGIQRPNWPASSPDINPIEHVWGWIKNKLTQDPVAPRNIEELKEKISAIWYGISQDRIQALFQSMPKRIQELYHRQGWNTSY